MPSRSSALRCALWWALSCAPILLQAQTAGPSSLAKVGDPQGEARDYRIEAGPLASVLNRLADEAGILFVADARLIQGKSSPGVWGRHGVRQAFALALEGSGLALVQEGSRYGLRRVEAPSQLAELPPVVAQAHLRAPLYQARHAEVALRTATPLSEVPQSVTVLPRAVLDDQSPRSMAEALRWVPGVGAAQGEGNRDTPVFRGTSSTADFLFDGMRDDVQYYRDVYNVERLEVLKGPNAMLQGRGSVGGLINRVGKEPQWRTHRELTLQVGSWAQRRATLDWEQRLSDTLAGRLNVMAEAAHSWRDAYWMRRSGINPVLAARLSRDTRLTMGLEHFEDDRLDDRGIPSWQGRPVRTGRGTFFGNPHESVSRVRMDAASAVLEHDLGEGRSLSNRTRYAYYDKFFRNVFAGAVPSDSGGQLVALTAHDSQTHRRNLVNQTDLVVPWQWGGWQHLLLTGIELSVQDGDNWRQTGYFTASPLVPVSHPTSHDPVVFRAAPNDPNSRSRMETAAVYLQDQIRWSPHWLAVLGLRHDRLDTRMRNRTLGVDMASRDQLWSPRVGLIYQPVATLSVYANHSIGYMPRAGEQLLSLNPGNQALKPEKYATLELGAKWAVHEGLEATAAVYRSRRGNVAVPDPLVVGRFWLVDGQQVDGLELGLSGAITSTWQVTGGYAYQDARLLATTTGLAAAGTALPHVPRNSLSLWSRFALAPRWAAGLGISYRGQVFTSNDNTVALPGYGRVDAALYYQPSPTLKLQFNAENVLDQRYYAFAHSNNNISPGSPRALRLSLITGF